MPHLRVVTWNPGGEADGRGAALDGTVAGINGAIAVLPAPQNGPVQVIAIQEANQAPGGLISLYMAGHAPPVVGTFTDFAGSRYHISEHHLLQVNRVGVSKGYIVALKSAGVGAVVPVAPAPNMIGANSGAGPLYRVDLWADAGSLATYAHTGGLKQAALQQAQKHMRWPVFTCFTVGGANVVFVTVHVEMKANWLGAVTLPHWAQGLREAVQWFFEGSTWFANATAWLGVNGLMVIAGDLNASPAELAMPGVLNNFVGASDNLSHILAMTTAPGGVTVTNHWAAIQNFPPHHILTAAIDW